VFWAAAIVFFISAVAIAEGPSIHIGPLFFLLMASLYTAMNNCQLPQVMLARLVVLSAGFFFIPLYDLVTVWPQMRTDLLTQLGTSVFVLFFIVECARKFASHYQAVRNKMEDLRVQRDKLANACEVQAQFVSIASHELRTPLTSVKASRDLINDERACKTMDDVRRIAGIGQRNGARLATRINDLLDFQKLDSNVMEFKMDRIDLCDIVREAAQVNRMLGKSREIGFDVNLPDEPVHVMADHDRLMQVMANVMSNAVKFSHDGGIVEIAVAQVGGHGQISIRDHGIGIPEKSRDLVFTPFAQVDGSDRRAYGGTGLGMSISRRIMEGQGGSIDFESIVGEGTAFVIALAADKGLQSEQVDTGAVRGVGWDLTTPVGLQGQVAQ
jgi:signal transduction histidine kinase